MTFLHRRRSFAPFLKDASDNTLSQLPPRVSHGPIENTPRPKTAPTGKVSPGRLIKRMFSSRRKRPSTVSSLVNNKIAVDFPKEGPPPSPSVSLLSEDDIRRPSGLGRSISISSSRSLRPPPSPFNDSAKGSIQVTDGYERVRSLSTPTLLRTMTVSLKAKIVRRSSTMFKFDPDSSPPAPTLVMPDIPPELLSSILFYLPRQTVASLATVSRNFCTSARTVLYSTLDLRTISPNSFEQLTSLLAHRRDLTDLVCKFICHTWPPYPRTNSKDIGARSFSSSLLIATFTVAFQRMHALTSIVLPSFDLELLRHHSAFGLKSLTFLNEAMSASDIADLFTWLDGQTNVTSLAFPNLIDDQDTNIAILADNHHHNLHRNTLIVDLQPHMNVSLSSIANITPVSSPASLFFPTPPASPFASYTLLPALTMLQGPPAVLTLLASNNRPLRHLHININTTLYTGLRPATLFAPLYGLSVLCLNFGKNVDRRTVEKVLGAAGATVGQHQVGDSITSIQDGLHTLNIELPESCTGTEALYKIIHMVLPRYCALHTLHLHRSSLALLPSSPSDSIHGLSDRERVHAASWVKQCPSLRSITFLSGATWQNDS